MRYVFGVVLTAALLIVPVFAQTDPQVTPTDIAPFLGKWGGEWKWQLGMADFGGRPCKLSVYIQDGQLFVDYYAGPAQTSRGSSRKDQTAMNYIDQKKIRAEVRSIEGFPTLIFTTQFAVEYYWLVKNGELLGKSRSASNDNACTLTKAK